MIKTACVKIRRGGINLLSAASLLAAMCNNLPAEDLIDSKPIIIPSAPC